MNQQSSNPDGKQYICSFHGSSSKPCCVSCECSNLTDDQWKILSILATDTLKNLNPTLPQQSEKASHSIVADVNKPNQLLLDNWKSPQQEPLVVSGWKTIEIYIFSNGHHDSPPRKYLFQAEDLHWWNATKEYIGRCHFGVSHSAVELYTLDGVKIETPLQLCNGAAYVVVEAPAAFQSAGYAHYMNKAQRSRAKREEKLKQGEDCISDTDCANQSPGESDKCEISEPTHITMITEGEGDSRSCGPKVIEDKLVIYHNIQTIKSHKSLPNTNDMQALVANPCFCYSAYSDMYSNAYIDYTIANIQSKNELARRGTCRKDCMGHVNIAKIASTRYIPNIISDEENIAENSLLKDNNHSFEGKHLNETLTDIIVKDAIKSELKQEYVRQSKTDKLARKPTGTVRRAFGSTDRDKIKNPELNKSPRISNTTPRKTYLAKEDMVRQIDGSSPNTTTKDKASIDENSRQIKPPRKYDNDILDQETVARTSSTLSLSNVHEDIEDKSKKSNISKASHETKTIASNQQNSIMPVTITHNIKSPHTERKVAESRTKEIHKAAKTEGVKTLAHSHGLPNITPDKAHSTTQGLKKIAKEKISAVNNTSFKSANEHNKNYDHKLSLKSKTDTKEKIPLTPRKVVIPKAITKKPNSPITTKKTLLNRPMSGKDRKVLPIKYNTAKDFIHPGQDKTFIKLNKQELSNNDNEGILKEHLLALTDLDEVHNDQFNSLDKNFHVGENPAPYYEDTENSTEIKMSAIENNLKVASPLVDKVNIVNSHFHTKPNDEKALDAPSLSVEIKDEATSFVRSNKGSQVEIEISVINKEQQVIYPIVLRRKSTNTTRSPSGDTLAHPVDEVLQFIVVKGLHESTVDEKQTADEAAIIDGENHDTKEVRKKSEQEINMQLTEKNDTERTFIKDSNENASKILKKHDHINKENIIIKHGKCMENCECTAQFERLYDLDDDTYDYFRLVKGTFVKIYINKNARKDQGIQEENITRDEETQDKVLTLEKNTNVEKMVEGESNEDKFPLKEDIQRDERTHDQVIVPVAKQAAGDIQVEDVIKMTDDRNPFSLFKDVVESHDPPPYPVHERSYDENQPAQVPTPSSTPATRASNVTRESTQPFTPYTLTSAPDSPLANTAATTPQTDTAAPNNTSYSQPQIVNLPSTFLERKPFDVGTQTSWSNLMLVPKLHSDGHISLHIPPLSAVKHNMYHTR